MTSRQRRRSAPVWAASVVIITAVVVVLPATVPAEGQAPRGRSRSVERGQAPGLLPNMTPLLARDVHIERVGGRRWLRLESGLANVGRGPMEVRSTGTRRCPEGQRHASQVTYHDVDGSKFFKRTVDTELTRRSAGCMLFHHSTTTGTSGPRPGTAFAAAPVPTFSSWGES